MVKPKLREDAKEKFDMMILNPNFLVACLNDSLSPNAIEVGT